MTRLGIEEEPNGGRNLKWAVWITFDNDKNASQEIYTLGVTVPLGSPPETDLVMVKETGGKMRLCSDCRQLKAAAVKDIYHLPKVDECLYFLG